MKSFNDTPDDVVNACNVSVIIDCRDLSRSATLDKRNFNSTGRYSVYIA
jgi:hypothetical protein